MFDFPCLKIAEIGIPMADLKVMVDHREVFCRGTGYADEEKTRKVGGGSHMRFLHKKEP